jgi:hypothetical protein
MRADKRPGESPGRKFLGRKLPGRKLPGRICRAAAVNAP